MKAISRSVNAIRKADGGNHRNPSPHATRPGMGRKKGKKRNKGEAGFRLEHPRFENRPPLGSHAPHIRPP